MNHVLSKTALAGVTAMALIVPGIASAVTVSPAGSFTATGTTELTPPGQNPTPIECVLTLTGNATQSGGVTISSVSIDPGDPACAALSASSSSLPWTGSFDSDALGLTLNGVHVEAPILGLTCGPASVNPDFANSTVTFNGTSLGACTIDGSLDVTPPQSVTP